MRNKKQDRLHLVLSNLQAIVINTVVCILCQTQLFSEKRNAVTEFGYSRDRLVQCIIGHGYLWWRGLMTGGSNYPVISLDLLEKRKISVKYCSGKL